MAFLAIVDDAGEGLPSVVELKEGLAMLDRRNLMLGAFAATAVTAVPTSAMALQNLTIDPSLTNLPGLKIAPEFYPVVVPVKRKFEVGSIHVISSQHFLYYIAKPGRAICSRNALTSAGMPPSQSGNSRTICSAHWIASWVLFNCSGTVPD